MDLRLAQTIQPVKLALINAAQKSIKRHLFVYQDKITCKPGCHSCCSRMIIITIAEAVVIHDYLVSTNKWFDTREKAKNQAKLADDANYVAWFKMNIKCPVLNEKTGLCQSYKYRPAICSVHFVKSDPKLCDPWSAQRGGYDPLDMSDLYEEFSKTLKNLVDPFGIFNIRVPLPIALLIAERIQIQSNLEIHKVISLLHQELK